MKNILKLKRVYLQKETEEEKKKAYEGRTNSSKHVDPYKDICNNIYYLILSERQKKKRRRSKMNKRIMACKRTRTRNKILRKKEVQTGRKGVSGIKKKSKKNKGKADES